jgi:large subunit ribosomal protein L3
MTIQLVGRKAGMTRIFTEDGVSVPVTVIEVEPNRVTQVKTTDTDGYQAIQVTVGSRRSSRVNKAAAGHYAKANVEAGRGLWEFRLAGDEKEINVGDELTVADFESIQMVDVTGQSKGKGFQGAIIVIILVCKTLLMVTRCLTVLLALSVNVKHLVVFGKARRWLAIWALHKLLLNH